MEQGKRETKVSKAIRLWTGATFAALLSAVAIYAVLLWVEKKELSEYERAEIYVAAREIPEGQMITEGNLEEFFTLEAVDTSLIPETAIRESAQVKDLVAKTKIDKGVLLTTGMFRPMDKITASMREPVVAGFRAEDLSQVAGGVLRAGDRIHIYAQEEDAGTFLIWENVYVQQVFDNGGKVIESGDEVTSAQRINVFLDREDVESFYTRLDQGKLRVVKIWRQEDE